MQSHFASMISVLTVNGKICGKTEHLLKTLAYRLFIEDGCPN